MFMKTIFAKKREKAGGQNDSNYNKPNSQFYELTMSNDY